jgi:hypothetical protein
MYTEPDGLPQLCDPHTAVGTAVPDSVGLPLEYQWAGWPVEADIQELLDNGYPSTPHPRYGLRR